ncbi:hypothetical protein FRC03_008172, partial [Tulasnella sp. 419]
MPYTPPSDEHRTKTNQNTASDKSGTRAFTPLRSIPRRQARSSTNTPESPPLPRLQSPSAIKIARRPRFNISYEDDDDEEDYDQV